MAHLKPLHKINLREFITDFSKYAGLPNGLIQLPVPDKIKIAGKKFKVPKDLNEFTNNICYGQRIFIVQKEENDFGLMIRQLDGYYYPIFTHKKWDADKALLFGKNVLTCTIDQIYPVSMHMTKIINEMAEREKNLLHREPSKIELAAGIEKLNVFAEMSALDFLRDTMKVTIPEVLLTPYNECLVRFMMAKENADYQQRYFELVKEEAKPKSKFHPK